MLSHPPACLCMLCLRVYEASMRVWIDWHCLRRRVVRGLWWEFAWVELKSTTLMISSFSLIGRVLPTNLHAPGQSDHQLVLLTPCDFINDRRTGGCTYIHNWNKMVRFITTTVFLTHFINLSSIILHGERDVQFWLSSWVISLFKWPRVY